MVKKSQLKYNRALDRLVPIALEHAMSTVFEEDFTTKEEYSGTWNRVFHTEMDRMAHQAGLRTSVWQLKEGSQ